MAVHVHVARVAVDGVAVMLRGFRDGAKGDVLAARKFGILSSSLRGGFSRQPRIFGLVLRTARLSASQYDHVRMRVATLLILDHVVVEAHVTIRIAVVNVHVLEQVVRAWRGHARERQSDGASEQIVDREREARAASIRARCFVT